MQFNFNHPKGGFAVKVSTSDGSKTKLIRANTMAELAIKRADALSDGFDGATFDLNNNRIYAL